MADMTKSNWGVLTGPVCCIFVCVYYTAPRWTSCVHQCEQHNIHWIEVNSMAKIMTFYSTISVYNTAKLARMRLAQNASSALTFSHIDLLDVCQMTILSSGQIFTSFFYFGLVKTSRRAKIKHNAFASKLPRLETRPVLWTLLQNTNTACSPSRQDVWGTLFVTFSMHCKCAALKRCTGKDAKNG